MKIYVASSWRNQIQPEVVSALREAGFEVYDFKQPQPGDNGFHWTECDPNWKNWTPDQFIDGLGHPIARAGFKKDMDALEGCDLCVLVVPCGRSAHLEAGYAIGANKPTAILLADGEPELMYKMASKLCTSIEEIVEWCRYRWHQSLRPPCACPHWDDVECLSVRLGMDGPEDVHQGDACECSCHDGDEDGQTEWDAYFDALKGGAQ